MLAKIVVDCFKMQKKKKVYFAGFVKSGYIRYIQIISMFSQGKIRYQFVVPNLNIWVFGLPECIICLLFLVWVDCVDHSTGISGKTTFCSFHSGFEFAHSFESLNITSDHAVL